MASFAQALLFLIFIAAGFSGVQAVLFGVSAIHQILTAVYFLMATVALAGMGIISAAKRPPEPREAPDPARLSFLERLVPDRDPPQRVA